MSQNTEKKEVVTTNEIATESGVGVLKLKTPIQINGEMTSEISYDLEGLTGEDVQHAIRELTKRNIQVLVAEVDNNYHAMLFSIASGLAFEDLKRLKLKDYTNMCSVVRNFFLSE